MKTFIELGACDFENLDSLLDHGWRGIFVEPVPKHNMSLQHKLTGKPNATVMPVAVSNKNGYLDMEIIDIGEDTPDWMKGISHVKVDSVANAASGLVDRNVTEDTGEKKQVITVPCMTLDRLIETCNITQIDFLQMDVEGHELVILEDYTWNVKPQMLKIEHKFIDDKRLTALLKFQGYHVFYERHDLYGFLL